MAAQAAAARSPSAIASAAEALDTYRPDDTPQYNFVLTGAGKKNCKSSALVLAALYRLVIRESTSGNDCYILANDEDQAGDAPASLRRPPDGRSSRRC